MSVLLGGLLGLVLIWSVDRAIRIYYNEPDFIIGPHDDSYLRRWWIVPRNRFFNIYLHRILRDDDDRALHDHPWINISILLSGNYFEVVPHDTCCYAHRADGLKDVWKRKRGSVVFRRSVQAHRLMLERDQEGKPIPVWSLFITGPKIREWGFLCPKGWRHWKAFCNERDSGQVGKGCAD